MSDDEMTIDDCKLLLIGIGAGGNQIDCLVAGGVVRRRGRGFQNTGKWLGGASLNILTNYTLIQAQTMEI